MGSSRNLQEVICFNALRFVLIPVVSLKSTFLMLRYERLLPMKLFRIFSALAAILKGQRLGVVKIAGGSMAPTFKAGKLLIVAYLTTADAKRTKQLQKLEVNDIVVFTREDQVMIKRIKRISKSATTNEMMIWVEGDNSLESIDSRQWGPIPLDLVEAVVLN